MGIEGNRIENSDWTISLEVKGKGASLGSEGTPEERRVPILFKMESN